MGRYTHLVQNSIVIGPPSSYDQARRSACKHRPSAPQQMKENRSTNKNIGINLYGRLDIFGSVEKITRDNVVDEVNSALMYHFMNLQAEEYLYWYRRGRQPILKRTKERNTIVLNKVVENHAEEIVTFKN